MGYRKSLLAEFIGTFALIFIGAGAVVALPANSIVAVALAHGLVIMTFAYAMGKDSRSYINPALTLAVFLAGEMSAAEAALVAAAQFAGGIAGAFALIAVYGPNAPHHLGATLIDPQRITVVGGFLLEAIGMFFFANVVLNTAVRKTAGDFAPFAIGMTVTLCIMSFGAMTGGSVNPARTLGPAIASGDYSQIGVYFAAQFAGAALASLLYRFVWMQPNDKAARLPAGQSALVH